MTDQQWKRIFENLDQDISDRAGVKFEWRRIGKDTLKEISSTWRKIVESELNRGNK